MNTVYEYLRWSSVARASMSQNTINGYSCLEDFMLKHGSQFTRIGKMPRGFKMGRNKHCFMNAAQLSLSIPSLIYCEGYALSILMVPMAHAWCVTRRGTVIDPTWADGIDYYGVPIRHDYLMESMGKTGVYGVIDLWEHDWPILKSKPEKFLALL